VDEQPSVRRVQEALDSFRPARRTTTERVSLEDAIGRVPAADVRAREPLPGFARSAVDGYAVFAADTAGATAQTPVAIELVGAARMGEPPPAALRPGTALGVATGSAVPDGADAIVMVEHAAAASPALVHVERAARPGQHLIGADDDFATGALLAPAGRLLSAREIAALAAAGQTELTVHRRPRVAILSTGDELRDLDEPERPGSIINSNAYALAALIEDAGCEPWILPNVGDDLKATLAAVRAGLAADVLITCGGVSVGDHDLVKAAFDEVGIDAGFWKVRIKPGKPLSFGRFGDKPVIGLPGNPISAMVTFEALVRPGLRAMLGDLRPYRARHEVFLAVDHRHGTGRVELARASIALENGRMEATPHRLQGSGSLPSWVGVDALLLLAEDRATFRKGEAVGALLLRDETASARSPFADPL
jgi:molybdopterin molybdotransferase